MCFVNGTTSTPKKDCLWSSSGIHIMAIIVLLYINDLPDSLDNTTPCLYADDTHIFSSAKDAAELIFNLNNDLDKISQCGLA